MIKQIVDFSRDENGRGLINLFVLAEEPKEHLRILKALIQDGAILQSVDSDTIRAVLKDSSQDMLLALLAEGWSFDGEAGEEPPGDEFAQLMEKLADSEREEAVREAADRFFNVRAPGLKGQYAIINLTLARGEATEEEMRADAERFGIDPEAYPEHWQQILLEQLEEAYDEELFDALQRAVEAKEARL